MTDAELLDTVLRGDWRELPAVDKCRGLVLLREHVRAFRRAPRSIMEGRWKRGYLRRQLKRLRRLVKEMEQLPELAGRGLWFRAGD